MANKIQRTIYLSAIVWTQVDELVDVFGDDQHEVLTQILNEWFASSREKIREQKTLVRKLSPKIKALQHKAERGGRSKSG